MPFWSKYNKSQMVMLLLYWKRLFYVICKYVTTVFGCKIGDRYPVPDFPRGQEGHGVQDSYNLRWHFSYHQSADRVADGGVCMQKCKLCGMQMSTAGTTAHEAFKTYHQVAVARQRHAVAAQGKVAPFWTFTAYDEPLAPLSRATVQVPGVHYLLR